MTVDRVYYCERLYLARGAKSNLQASQETLNNDSDSLTWNLYSSG